MFIPKPVISFSVRTKKLDDIEKLSKALHRFIREDPTFQVHVDNESKETIISVKKILKKKKKKHFFYEFGF